MRRIAAQGVGVASVFFFRRRWCGGFRFFRLFWRVGNEAGEDTDQKSEQKQSDEEGEQYGRQCFN